MSKTYYVLPESIPEKLKKPYQTSVFFSVSIGELQRYSGVFSVLSIADSNFICWDKSRYFLYEINLLTDLLQSLAKTVLWFPFFHPIIKSLQTR